MTHDGSWYSIVEQQSFVLQHGIERECVPTLGASLVRVRALIECAVRAHSSYMLFREDSSCLGRVRVFARTLFEGYSERIRAGQGGFAHLRER